MAKAKYKFNPFTGKFDIALDYTDDLALCALLDGSNQPFTGNIEVAKADPTITLTDSGNSYSTDLTKSDTSNLATRKNDVDYNNVGATTMLLLHCDGAAGGVTFTDSSSYARTITRVLTSITTETAQKKFGTASAFSTGAVSNGRLNVDNTTGWFALGTTDFTIDFWIYPTASAGSEFILVEQGADLSVAVMKNGTGIYLYASANGTSWGIANGKLMGNAAQDTWSHIAVTRSGSNWYMFVDGVLSGVEFSSATAVFASVGAIQLLGYSLNTGYAYTGYCDEFRVVIGSAEWTAPFTPPTAPYGAATSAVPVWESEDGVDAGDRGILKYGDEQSKTILRGRKIIFEEFGTQIGQFEADGTFSVPAGYEAKVTADGDIPNKKYVDDADLLRLLLTGGTLAGNLLTNSDIEITDATKGIILTSPDTTRWRITIDNAGVLVTTSL